MEIGRKRIIVAILSIMLLTASIIVIVLLKKLGNKEKPVKVDCALDDLSGEILNYPTKNDDDVIVNYSKEYYDEHEEPRDLTVYVYKDYSVVIGEDKYDPELHYFIIKDINNDDIYRQDNIIVNITGTTCEQDGSFIDGKSLDTFPMISDGKLYYVIIGERCYDLNETEKRAYFEYEYIDLNDEFLDVGSVSVQSLKLMGTYENQNSCFE